jgi:hypothetical protein
MVTRFLSGVLSVIAVGLLLIAYGLLKPAAAYSPVVGIDEYGRPVVINGPALTSDRSMLAAPTPVAYAPAADMRIARPAADMRIARPAPAAVPQVAARAPGRDWKKTALVIGGSTAAGAGVGGIFGGKKGALIGAAIGGGASTIYESLKK